MSSAESGWDAWNFLIKANYILSNKEFFLVAILWGCEEGNSLLPVRRRTPSSQKTPSGFWTSVPYSKELKFVAISAGIAAEGGTKSQLMSIRWSWMSLDEDGCQRYGENYERVSCIGDVVKVRKPPGRRMGRPGLYWRHMEQRVGCKVVSSSPYHGNGMVWIYSLTKSTRSGWRDRSALDSAQEP